MAPKPVIFTVDDDPGVLRAIERDLRQHFGKDYRVLRADSGQTALETLRQLVLRNEPVALLLSDQRMPGMSGVEFLEKARELYPDARRALLTAYADTDAAIKAINTVKIDYYLLKPWDPPEERLYPVLQELLDDWVAAFRPTFEGVRIIDHRWSPRAHDLKDFLARNQIPYHWLDIESGEEAKVLLKQLERTLSDLPIVLMPDGSHLLQPTTAELAEKIGLRTRTSTRHYDLIIVGAGPAGLGAAVYGASEGLSTLMIERSAPGGQAGQSSAIENYLGFPNGLSGYELTRRALTQAERFGAELLRPQTVSGLRVQDNYRFVQLEDGSEVSCHALVIATGISYRRLEVPGIDPLTGAGVYYGAAVTEAVSCRDNAVYVVGAGNSAGQAALYLAKYASHVTMLVRPDYRRRKHQRPAAHAYHGRPWRQQPRSAHPGQPGHQGRGPGSSPRAVHLYRGGPTYQLGRRCRRPRPVWLYPHRARPDGIRQAAQRLDARPRSVLSGIQRARRVCGR
jgi:thioredoxin reductase (NADPH)